MNAQLPRRNALKALVGLAVSTTGFVAPALAMAQDERPEQISSNELINSGHRFFGNVSRDLALAIQKAVSRWGLPNGYVLGQEGSGAFVGGLRYGEGTLFTRNVGDRKVYWQGPSVGWDFGGDGARTMMLVYNMGRVDEVFGRFGGIHRISRHGRRLRRQALGDGSMPVVPIKSVSGRGSRRLGYLKFTPSATWNPF